MSSEKVEQVNSVDGTFSVTHRKDCSYSKRVESQEELVRVMKGEEQADGTALYTETLGLRYNPKKDV